MREIADYVVVANGEFPVHPAAVRWLHNAPVLVCCDGAAERVIGAGLKPGAIVGDCDSLSPETEREYHHIIMRSAEQESNDLTKAVRWCIEKGAEDVVILGATGQREDHTLGNISLLAEYSAKLSVKMVTNWGTLIPLSSASTLQSFRGQVISLFGVNNTIQVTATGLEYDVDNLTLGSWWRATLNRATGNSINIEMSHGTVIIFMQHKEGDI